ncbi:MAG TPA: hypothetical protein VKG45_14795 [Actinomycetes bacterium]|nr:hypothetical protein [Actinomycetes bacterium]
MVGVPVLVLATVPPVHAESWGGPSEGASGDLSGGDQAGGADLDVPDGAGRGAPGPTREVAEARTEAQEVLDQGSVVPAAQPRPSRGGRRPTTQPARSWPSPRAPKAPRRAAPTPGVAAARR